MKNRVNNCFKKMTSLIPSALLFILMVILSACANKTSQQIKTHPLYSELPPPADQKKNFYVSVQPIAMKQEPDWLKQNVTFQARNMPLAMLVNRLVKDSQVKIAYDATVQSKMPVTLDYSGTVEGALSRLVAQTHYHYMLTNNQLAWSAFITQTFNLVGQSPQYSNVAGQVSVWSDLMRTLNQLKSPAGKMFVSQPTSSVTVRDYPLNVGSMQNYITQLNHSLSQEIGIKVEVLEIQLNKSYSAGINWNAVAKTLGAAAATSPLAEAISSTVTSATSSFEIGKDDAQALLSALSQQGKLRVVAQPQVVTLNNQMASVEMAQDQGFTLDILPRIQDDKISMQVTSPLFNQQQFNATGQTLVIAGIKRSQDSPTKMDIFGIEPSGGKVAQGQNTETLMLITPTILQG